MSPNFRSLFRIAVELELAGVLTAAEATQRFAELSLRFGENVAVALLQVAAPEPNDVSTQVSGTGDIAEIYRGYVRELAAASSLASMSFLGRLEELRAQRKGRGGGRDGG
jgi:hypothetical protein